ncbi:MAG TPA: hypothetical protein VGP24_06080 [Glaciihabitans sp.]|jgi:hypothetical protein|nr:hypothetical protein [Glaciihabitans sp.]
MSMDTAWVVAFALAYSTPVAAFIIIVVRLKNTHWLDETQRVLNAHPRTNALFWIFPALAGLTAIVVGIALLSLYPAAGWAAVALGGSGLLLSGFYIRIITRPFPAESSEAEEETFN